ncbi:MAG: hypothetical protein Q4G08_05300 [Capnocytophaga sp.]|nr:hypothetical protein [Capnocytophaga sp.]
MKKYFLIFSIIPLLQGCPDHFEKCEGSESYVMFKDRSSISFEPDKKIYKVGDTLRITYRLPNRINNSTVQEFNADISDFHHEYPFNIREYSVSDSLSLSFSEYPRQDIYSMFYKKEQEERKFPRYKLVYNSSNDEYICTVKFVFYKSGIFYWMPLKDIGKPNRLHIVPKQVYVDNYLNPTVSLKGSCGVMIDYNFTEPGEIAFRVEE